MPPAPDAESATFIPWSSSHWAAITVVVVASAVFSVLLRRTAAMAVGAAIRRWTCWGLAALLFGGAIAEQIYEVATGTWRLQESLPLHLCDIGVFVTALALLGEAREQKQGDVLAFGVGDGLGLADRGVRGTRFRIRQQLYELAYFWGVGGTVQAVLTPDLNEVFPSFPCIRYFMLHGGLIVAVVMMTLGLRKRPRPGAVVRAWLLTAALAPPVMLVNWLAGSNYMYLAGPPAHPSLYDSFGRWPWSLLTLVVVGTGFFMLCYLPFWVVDRRRRE